MESELTISQINSEIAALRAQFDVTRASLDPVKGERASLEKQEQAIRANFELTMRNLMNAQSQIIQQIADISKMMNSITHSIEEKQRLLAQMLKDEAAKRSLELLAQDLDVMLQSFDAWQKATDYQKEDTLFGLQAFREGKNGILNANDMGLGKTFETIVLLRLLQEEWSRLHNRKPSILVLTKKSLVKSTLREFHKWDKQQLMLPLLETTSSQRDSMFQLIVNQLQAILITNYEAINTTALIRDHEWDIIVIDECHKLKGGANLNGQTKIFKNAKALCQKARFVIMLSGTPMVNHPREMWSYLHVFDPERFDSLRRFNDMFVDIYDMAKGEYVLNADKLLKQALKGQVIRRRKDEVGIQLPELLHAYRYLEMTQGQQELADMMSSSFFIWLDKQAEDKVMIPAQAIIAQLMRLRQINVWPPSIKVHDVDDPKIKHAVNVHESIKINEAMDIIKELADTDEQVVLACCFNEPMWEIQRRCKEEGITCEVLTGLDSKNTDQYEQRFQQNETQVLCINLAIGEGLNLHKNRDYWPGGASNLIMMDLWWSPARNEQMQARIHRPGAHQTCTIHILHNEGSVDNLIAALVEEKSATFANIMESAQLRPAVEWKELIMSLMGKNKSDQEEDM